MESLASFGCVVVVCFSDPTLVSLFIPSLKTIKTLLSIGWTMTFEVNPLQIQACNNFFRLSFSLWIMATSFILILFGEHVLFAVTNVKWTKSSFLPSLFVVIRLFSPSYMSNTGSFRLSKRAFKLLHLLF